MAFLVNVFRGEIFSLNQNEAVGFVGKATNELLPSTAPRLEHLNKQKKKQRIKDYLCTSKEKTGSKLQVEDAGKEKKTIRDAVFSKQLIFAIDWYIALDNSVVISGRCWLVF